MHEAFQQADGSTSRKYGGTGLGLAISRELSRLLRGEIRLVSAPSKGSVFSLYLPAAFPASRMPRKSSDAAAVANAAIEAARQAAERRLVDIEDEPRAEPPQPLPAPQILVNEADDDRESIHPGDRSVLIVENDLAFARVLLEAAREQGFKGLVTTQGTAALTLVHEYKPAAIMLDIFLPDIDGWRVLSRLKNDLAVRHTPVHVISTDEARDRALSSGARRFIAKPIQSRKAVDEVMEEVYRYVSNERRKVLIVEPDPSRLASVQGCLSGLENLEIVTAGDAARAAELFRDANLDCAIVNPNTPELDLHQLVEERRENDLTPPPIIAYGRQLAASIGAASVTLESIPGVREVHSLERLLDAVVVALHIDVSHVKEEHRKVLDEIYGSTKALAGRRVLIVDDDIRNIFALSSVLEDYGMEIKTADNGREAIALAQKGDLDIVLMDIMMPEMDGLETTKEIRKIPSCKDLPIVAVTAKAMKGDRERCIEAGAWDYLSKPVDREQLLTVLKAWLQR
ncbi:MAG: response regulator [Betaproteobacteria bacterium]